MPKPCTVHIPPHLAKFLYREAAAARRGRGGLHVEETDIVIALIERWAATLPPVDWAALYPDLKGEAEATGAAGETPKTGRRSKKGRKG